MTNIATCRDHDSNIINKLCPTAELHIDSWQGTSALNSLLADAELVRPASLIQSQQMTDSAKSSAKYCVGKTLRYI